MRFPEPSIPCGEAESLFWARVEYAGYAYGDTYYDVLIRVESLAEANAKVEQARVSIARERPQWREIGDARLKSTQWRDNPVYVVLSYAYSESN